MLLKRSEDNSFVGELPCRPLIRGGTRTHLAAAAATTFNGVYMRPNLNNTGTIPAGNPLSACPDIWIANQTPVANFQTALATPSSYASSSNSNITGGMPNFIYVRGYNNMASAQSRTVNLYYSPSAVICWPGQWQNNVLKTDQGQSSATISNLAAQKVGVADGVFVWDNPPPPPPGSDHYCLMAQMNDSANSNPFPSIYSSLDMGALVMNNLGWGWRNTSYISGSGAQEAYNVGLDIPINIVAPGNQYSVYLTPVGFIGWDVQMTCSQTDSTGKPITLPRQRITTDNQIMGVSAVLEPGFTATLYVTMWSNGKVAAAGATIPVDCTYKASGATATEAFARGLVDPVLLRAMQNAMRIGPTAVVNLGGYNWTSKG